MWSSIYRDTSTHTHTYTHTHTMYMPGMHEYIHEVQQISVSRSIISFKHELLVLDILRSGSGRQMCAGAFKLEMA
jgi:hypothetical protein